MRDAAILLPTLSLLMTFSGSAFLVGCGGGGTSATQVDVEVQASVETAPVHHGGDAADDPCIWIHPSDPTLSTVIADDKQGGLLVYDLVGNELQWIDQTLRLNNVDLRYGFPLDGTYSTGGIHATVTLVVVGNESTDALRFYKVNPTTRLLEAIGDHPTGRARPYGGCLYHSAVDDLFHAFVTYKSGWTEQWALSDAGGGLVTALKMRQFDVGSQTEGCVADDALGVVYLGEETVAIWRYGAEPGDGDQRTAVTTSGTFVPDIEGLAIYHGPGTSGYLVASSQGDHSFRIFDRTFGPGAANSYRGSFAIRPGLVDGVSDTDGLEIVSLPLSPAFPSGLLVVQDGRNAAPGNSGNQNYKFVPWERVALGFGPPLLTTTDHDPRLATIFFPGTAQ
jgi:3-phytase